MLHVWGFDPGETSGWAHLSIRDDEISLFRTGQADHFEIGDMLRNEKVFCKAQQSEDIETVFVCESFKVNSKHQAAPWSLETIGLVRFWAHHYFIPLTMQTPSEAKSLVTDKVLKASGLWIPGRRHENDAVIHAAYYLIKERGMLTWLLVS